MDVGWWCTHANNIYNWHISNIRQERTNARGKRFEEVLEVLLQVYSQQRIVHKTATPVPRSVQFWKIGGLHFTVLSKSHLERWEFQYIWTKKVSSKNKMHMKIRKYNAGDQTPPHTTTQKNNLEHH